MEAGKQADGANPSRYMSCENDVYSPVVPVELLNCKNRSIKADDRDDGAQYPLPMFEIESAEVLTEFGNHRPIVFRLIRITKVTNLLNGWLN